MTAEGARLAARFSLPTNRLDYCGPRDASDLFLRAIADGSDIRAASDALLRFEALVPYLRAIARKHGLDPLDAAVVEAYWVGNELLEDFRREDFAAILRDFRGRGLPDALVRRLLARLPETPLPHHAFHVAFVGVGAVTGKVETTVANMDLCRPSWAVVREVRGDGLVARRRPLEARDGRIRLGAERLDTFPREDALVPGVRPGDVVGIHWGLPVIVLTPAQADRLRAYTERALDLVPRAEVSAVP
jgi:GNAT superfamily N-acetyltransferase